MHRAACLFLILLVGCGGSEHPPTEPASPASPTPAAPAEPTPEPSVPEPLPSPPVARVEPKELAAPHGHVRVDPYYWMKDRESEEVLDYLRAENAYTQAVMKPTDALQEQLFEEITGRIAKDDTSVPYLLDGWWYQSRYVEGGEYPIYERRKGSMDAAPQVLVNGNERAEGKPYFAARQPVVNSDDTVAAWAEDHVGRRIYTIFFRDLATGELRDERIEEVTGNLAWAMDGKTLFYARQDPETLRSFRIYRHVLGADPSSDAVVFEEKDDTFSCYVWRTKSKKYLVIGSYQTVSSEMRVLDASDPTGRWTVVQPRARDHEYTVDHLGDSFYVRTNLDAKNFRLMKAPVATPGQDHWTEVIGHRDDTLLEGFELFSDWLVTEERRGGLVRLRVQKHDGTQEHVVQFDDPAWTAGVGTNPSLDSDTLRFSYSSMTTPPSVFDYDMVSHDKELMKEQPVLGGFDKTLYEAARIEATAKDGTKVPISLVYRKDLGARSKRPTVLYGYGSYGYSLDASFSSARLSLLDRGMVWAVAHIRGGEELGRAWYEDGKLLNKKNTFTDFIAAGEHLVQDGWADPERLYAMGGSAGGLLVGAVINMRPDLWDGAVAAVPFVDVVTTMLDDSIPLTTGEYDEWGNPNEQTYYEYMLSYSPYDQVSAQAYPALLVTSGLHDSQVQYWEPTKWVAKLRATATGEEPILLHTNMDAGHGGKSGRFEKFREVALEYAFFLKQADLVD